MSEESPLPNGSPDVWVLEGVLDFPITLPQPKDHSKTGRFATGLVLDFSDGTADGFIEITALDEMRVRESTWWSREEPQLLQFRAAVRAHEVAIAKRRSIDFLNQILDRLTFLAGVPARVAALKFLYNETDLVECKVNMRKNFRLSPIGTPTSKTQPLHNVTMQEVLSPGDRAKRALRWFRRALTFDLPEDQFLAFYFALEAISNDVKLSEQKTHRCHSCGGDSGIAKAQTDGIKELIKAHPEWVGFSFGGLAKLRAKIVHGGVTGSELNDLLAQLVPLVQRLAAEGICRSVGSDVNSVVTIPPNNTDIVLIATAEYSADSCPHTSWKGKSIGDVIKETRVSIPANHTSHGTRAPQVE